MKDIHEKDFCAKYCTHYNDEDYNSQTSACGSCYDGSNFEDKEEVSEQLEDSNPGCSTGCPRHRFIGANIIKNLGGAANESNTKNRYA
jgi:hypothetical protein